MLNLSITATCNRNCDYCFALDVLKTKSQVEMDLLTFEQSLDLAERSGASEVRLLGGEPTIHRHFNELLDLALSRGLKVVVLTGGLIPNKVLSHLETTSPDDVSLLLNVVPPWEHQPAMHRKQQRVMRLLSERVALGLNIDQRGVTFDFLLEWIDRHRLERTVRLGLAHPIWGGGNSYLNPKHYSAIGGRVSHFAYAASQSGVSISFDCGWVPCMFPEGVLEDLGLGPRDIGLRCSPILDVLVDGDVISCYPLANHTRSRMSPESTTHALRQEFQTAQQIDRTATIFSHCSSCEYFKAEQCTGGCLSASLNRQRTSAAIPATSSAVAGNGANEC